MDQAKPQSFAIECDCGKQFQAARQVIGRRVHCPACGRGLLANPASPAPSVPAPVEVHCRCGGRFRAPASLIGRKVDCPRCGGAITIDPSLSVGSSVQGPSDELPLVQPLSPDEFWSDGVVGESAKDGRTGLRTNSPQGWKATAGEQRRLSPAAKFVLATSAVAGMVLMVLIFRIVVLAHDSAESWHSRSPGPTWTAHRIGPRVEVLLPGISLPTEFNDLTMAGVVRCTEVALETDGPTSYLVRHVALRRETLLQQPSDSQLLQAISRSALQSARAGQLRPKCSVSGQQSMAEVDGEFSRDGDMYYVRQQTMLRHDDVVVLQWIAPASQVQRRDTEKTRFLDSLKW